MTMKDLRSALDRIDGNLDQILTTPLKMAIDYNKTLMNSMLTRNFKYAYEQLQPLIAEARRAFHYANKQDIEIESYR